MADPFLNIVACYFDLRYRTIAFAVERRLKLISQIIQSFLQQCSLFIYNFVEAHPPHSVISSSFTFVNLPKINIVNV